MAYVGLGRAAAAAALVAIGSAGCGSSLTSDPTGPNYRQAPIWLSDPTGTYTFTVDAPTPVLFNGYGSTPLFLSPGRTRIVQTRSDRTTADVYDIASGTLLADFDSSLEFVGWTGEDTLIFNNNIVNAVVRANVAGSVGAAFDFGFPADAQPPSLWRAATSRDGKYLAVSFLDADILILDTESGAIVQRYPLDQEQQAMLLTWLPDRRLVIWGGYGPGYFSVATPPSAAVTKALSPVLPCSVEPWTPARPLLLGASTLSGDVVECVGRVAARADGTGQVPLTWLADPTIPGSTPVYALSPDARRVVHQDAYYDIVMTNPDGGDASVLFASQQPATTLTW